MGRDGCAHPYTGGKTSLDCPHDSGEAWGYGTLHRWTGPHSLVDSIDSEEKADRFEHRTSRDVVIPSRSVDLA